MPRQKGMFAGISAGDPAISYAAALASPFSDLAEGARVIDRYTAETVVRRRTSTFNVSSDANGEVLFAAFPSLYLNGYAYKGAMAGGESWTDDVGSSISGHPGVSPAELGNLGGRYRIVGWGMKIMSDNSALNRSGHYAVASFAGPKYLPRFNGVGWKLGGVVLGGIPTSQGWSDMRAPTNMATCQNFSKCMRTSAEAISGKSCEFVSKMYSPNAFDFRRTADVNFGTDYAGGPASGDASHHNMDGWHSFVVCGEGLPVNTSVLTVEIIYHIEITEGLASLTGSFLDDSAKNVASPSNYNTFQRILDNIERAPWAKIMDVAADVVETASTGNVVGTIRRIVGGIKQF